MGQAAPLGMDAAPMALLRVWLDFLICSQLLTQNMILILMRTTKWALLCQGRGGRLKVLREPSPSRHDGAVSASLLRAGPIETLFLVAPQNSTYSKVVEVVAPLPGDRRLRRARGKHIGNQEKNKSKYYYNPIITLLRLDANDFHAHSKDDGTSSSDSDHGGDAAKFFRSSDNEHESPGASRCHSRRTSPPSRQSIGADCGRLSPPLAGV